MSEDKRQKIQAWNYDKLDVQKSPEVKNDESLGRAGAGKSLGNNPKEYGMPRIFILTPMIIAILVVALFFSRVYALILDAVGFVPVIFFYDRANEKLGNGSALIFWIIFAIVLAVVVWFMPAHPF